MSSADEIPGGGNARGAIRVKGLGSALDVTDRTNYVPAKMPPTSVVNERIAALDDGANGPVLVKRRGPCPGHCDRQDVLHGSNGTYLGHRCRCDLCRAGHAAYMNRWAKQESGSESVAKSNKRKRELRARRGQG